MKTLCKLKRKEVARHLEAIAQAELSGVYLCRECLRMSPEKKRLCEPAALQKIMAGQIALADDVNVGALG